MKNNADIIIAGAAPDTGNAGVTALLESTIFGLSSRGIQNFTILDNGNGNHRLNRSYSKQITVNYHTLNIGRRWYKSTNLINALLKQQLGLTSPFTDLLSKAAAYLDISGGDSFTDLYGTKRFNQITLPKRMVLKAGIPLILLPQTIGPFKHKKSRDIARDILKKSSLVIARDQDSLERIKDLVGSAFNPNQFILGLDMAFGLPKASINQTSLKPLYDQKPIGINVSGLLWNDPQNAREQFSLKANYKKTLIKLIHNFAEKTDRPILLIPHVMPEDKTENDLVACQSLKTSLPEEISKRVFIISEYIAPQTLKGVINECCWFTGSRMHATIAALTSETAVSNMAYSVKSKGVFAHYNNQNEVYDMRELSTDALVDQLFKSFENRQKIKATLSAKHSAVMDCWAFQLEMIAQTIPHLKSRGKHYA
ncbi:polysaccharide pyruvyl transferase family protein [Temperatibacter marinus]|uniref:Polysaccharide pyruvyl transferase family protein n=1 Tax=Temperatibacter marinus TaxID=1456591 RepID=A0AA52HB51_9PROT|nr:polysaccharide pyruvyl transferase family protein [Temperatibacter marinus]WND03278.1 polysaccharide pyruvyl transferase family protein [Temperatibacter marinus]